jgi:hypothetical protein
MDLQMQRNPQVRSTLRACPRLTPPPRGGAALVLAFALALASCAHHGAGPAEGGLSSVDTVDAAGQLSNLAALGAQVVVVDICAAWSDACIVNARTLAEACDEVCGHDAKFVTLLLDQIGGAALASYESVLKPGFPVLLPGPRTLGGQSVLGEVGEAIPRLVIFGPDGRIAADEAGGILSARGIVNRVKGLLGR